MRRSLALLTVALALPIVAQAQFTDPASQRPGRLPSQPIDEAYTKKIKEYTTESFFNSPLTDYLPARAGVPTPTAVLGDIAGAPGKLPITGNETVLDALTQINGISRVSSKRIWIARPMPGGAGCDAILPVNWKEITAGGATATNYQILPGDRIFIAEDKLVAIDAALNKMIAPFERIFGVSLLGAQAIQTMNRFPLGFTGGLGGF